MRIAALFLVSALFLLLARGIPNPGVRITLEEKEVAGLLNPLLDSYLSGIQSLAVPDILYDVIIQLNVTNITAYDFTFDSAETDSAAGQGLWLNVTNMGLKLNSTVHYHFPLPGLKGSFSMVSTVNETNIQILIDITEQGGKPHLAFDHSELSIGFLDPGFPSTIIEYIVNITDVNRFIRDELGKHLPEMVSPAIDQTANDLFANLSMEISLFNGTSAFNLSVASDPVFTDTTIEIDLAGTVANWTCFLPYNTMPYVTSPTSGLTAQINGQIPNCLLLNMLNSGQLSNSTSGILDRFLPLDGRVQLVPGFVVTGLPVTFTTDGIDVQLGLKLDVIRTDKVGPTTETYFTLNHISISFFLLPYVVDVNDAINISASLRDFDFSIEGPPYASWAADMPTVYADQLQNQNWTDLSAKANELLATQAIPKLIPLLAQGFALPSFLGSFISKPSLESDDGYLTLEADFGFSPTPSQ
jgi:hypothetical protein